MKYTVTYTLASAVFLFSLFGNAIAEPGYDGRKKCSSCHKSQAESWLQTAHAKAMKSLEPNAKADAKRKAKLDPAKDYTKDKECVGCHVDGFGKEGGYTVEEPSKYTANVGCESCHGPGSEYRQLHRKAGAAFEKSKKTMPRQALADAGQDMNFVEGCSACHLNYEGSPWKGAKKPYTPFTPQVDKKYTFDFDKAVANSKAMHEHYKLDGTFTGEPIFKLHDEFQSKAKVGVKGKED
ncbi:MAG: cytochrome c-550 CycA [Nitrosomonadaceae bacterium]|jgi:hypothetical protein|nr:cytochrome c-550 CycA [Nitrosomonadaceae bacterium]MDW7652594.1 cytochrome c-550 CycA [Nitrosomonadaceae bacterium]MDW7663808.1 cytochrome c-550 CycA [Nitrosomonadaceae bacterium]MDW7664672.1 cytochrome c-550 CycA [Nitrosomonadaceae bacterium]